jgi:protein SCO1/2
MTHPTRRTDRRTVLKTVGAAALGVSLAGCSVLGDEGAEGTVLPPPENHERVEREDIDLPYPAYGEELPEVTLPAPLHDREVTTTEFVGDRHSMMTFIYTSCVTVCPGLTTSLRRVQADSIGEGYAGEFAFLPTTFDPAYDTEERLREYGEAMGVDFGVGNWFFLRPDGPEAAKEVVEGTFGVAFEGGEMSGGGNETAGGDGEPMRHFQHSSLILLVNKDGIVERAYNGGPPETGTEIDDARTLVEEW